MNNNNNNNNNIHQQQQQQQQMNNNNNNNDNSNKSSIMRGKVSELRRKYEQNNGTSHTHRPAQVMESSFPLYRQRGISMPSVHKKPSYNIPSISSVPFTDESGTPLSARGQKELNQLIHSRVADISNKFQYWRQMEEEQMKKKIQPLSSRRNMSTPRTIKIQPGTINLPGNIESGHSHSVTIKVLHNRRANTSVTSLTPVDDSDETNSSISSNSTHTSGAMSNRSNNCSGSSNSHISTRYIWYEQLLQSPPPVLLNTLLGGITGANNNISMMQLDGENYSLDNGSILNIDHGVNPDSEIITGGSVRNGTVSSSRREFMEDADSFNEYFVQSSRGNIRLNIPDLELYQAYRDKSILYSKHYPQQVLCAPFISYDSVCIYDDLNINHLGQSSLEYDSSSQLDESDFVNMSLDNYEQWQNIMQKRLADANQALSIK
jgi:hypothetical protein